ncbi:hypothetical protein TNCV_4619311 [Trichonephila clavipes]|nr:hypothetical protein TNCV_4619311 [Trichonephila clavipes]
MTKRVLFQCRSGASASFIHVAFRSQVRRSQSPYAGGGLSCSGGQSEARPQCPQASLVLIYRPTASRDERLSQPCPARE